MRELQQRTRGRQLERHRYIQTGVEKSKDGNTRKASTGGGEQLS